MKFQMSQNKDTDEYDNYSTTNRFETLWFEYPTNFVMEDIAFDYEAIVPNADATFTIKIKNAPTAHPINAPTIGINAVNEIKTPTNNA